MALVFVGTFFYADELVTWLRIPLQNYFILDSWEWVPSDLPKIPLVFLAPAEALWQNVKVAGLCALVLTTPYWLWEIWQFVVPGLHTQERRFIALFLFCPPVCSTFPAFLRTGLRVHCANFYRQFCRIYSVVSLGVWAHF
jgi:Sec-independent protein secretion pathway component TatC